MKKNLTKIAAPKSTKKNELKINSLSQIDNEAPLLNMEDEGKEVFWAKDITQSIEEKEKLQIFKTAFEYNSSGIIITDAGKPGELPKILYANNAMAKISGYSIAELIGKKPSILSGPETDLREMIRLSDSIKKNIHAEFEFLNYKKNGQKFWNKFSIVSVFNPSGNVINWISMQEDVTQKKKQIQELAESENKFRNLLEYANVGIYILNLKDVLFANTKICKILGYSEFELLNIPIKTWVHPDDYLVVQKFISKALQTGVVVESFEFRVISKSGEIKYLTKRGTRIIFQGKVAIIGTIIDSTEAKKSNEKIRKFSQAIEQSETSIVITDLAGQIEYINPFFSSLTGYTLEETLGQNPRILKSGITPSKDHENLWRKLENNESWKGLFCNKKKNGEIYWEQAIISPVFDENGVKINYVAVKEDITSRVKLEEEKERLIKEISENYNDLKQFSYITSHNLRAPLTNLVAIVELLDISKITDKTTLLLIEGFKKSTLQLNETLQELIKTIIIKEGSSHEFVDIPLDELFQHTKSSIEGLIIKQRCTFDVDFEAAPSITGIKPYIESIFLNLITNSIKYAQEGIPPHITIRSWYEDKKLILRFTDNGKGMDYEKVKNRLFGLYQKFHKKDDSKGIGLYLVKSHIKAMKGQIEVNTAVNKGTTFTIIFEPENHVK